LDFKYRKTNGLNCLKVNLGGNPREDIQTCYKNKIRKMEIAEFNKYMRRLELANEIPKDIGLLMIIESLLDEKTGKWKKLKKGHVIIPPWLYDIKDSFIILNFGEGTMEIKLTDNGLLSVLKEQKPYIKMIEEDGWKIDAPISAPDE
jgi:hypothetical protein